MPENDDTKPRSPFADMDLSEFQNTPTPPRSQPPVNVQEGFVYADEQQTPPPVPDQPTGPGCIAVTLVIVMGLGFMVVIIGLAGLAGWTSGQRQAEENVLATRSAEINTQLRLLPDDIAEGNTVLVDRRLQYLVQLTPGVQGVDELRASATALYLTSQPTATPIPTETPTVTPTAEVQVVEEASSEAEVEITPAAGNQYDVAGLLQEAQSAFSQGQLDDAIDLLDVIIAVDPNYETQTVRGLMSEALNRRALELLRGGELARGIFLADRADEFGSMAEGLPYERYIAGLYLDAIAAVGTDYPTAIAALNALYSEAPNYRGGEVQQLLFEQYVGYGDAFRFEERWCSAQQQYENALRIFSRSDISNRRDTMEENCQNPPETSGEDGETESGEGGEGGEVAPIGER